jgi:hypothetical protein
VPLFWGAQCSLPIIVCGACSDRSTVTVPVAIDGVASTLTPMRRLYALASRGKSAERVE